MISKREMTKPETFTIEYAWEVFGDQVSKSATLVAKALLKKMRLNCESTAPTTIVQSNVMTKLGSW